MEFLFTVCFFSLSDESQNSLAFSGLSEAQLLKHMYSELHQICCLSELDLWQTGAVGEHLKWQELWWLAEDQACGVLCRSLFRVLSASAQAWMQGLQSGIWLQSLGSIKRRTLLLCEFIFASLFFLIGIGVGIEAGEPWRRGREWLRNKFVWGSTEVEQKICQHISCGGEWVRWFANTKLKALELKALNCLFASPWAVTVPQLLPLGTDYFKGVYLLFRGVGLISEARSGTAPS